MRNDPILPASSSTEADLTPARPPAEALPAEADIDATPDLDAEVTQDWEDNEVVAESQDRPARAEGVTPPSQDLPVTIIRPTGGWRALDLREVWRYRELMLTLAWREITIR